MSISSFYENQLGAKLANSRWSWGAVDKVTDRIFLRVWKSEIEHPPAGERVLLRKGDWETNSNGYDERTKHIQKIRNGSQGYGVVCERKKSQSKDGSKIANFNQETLLKFGDIIDDGSDVFAEVIDRVSVKDLARQQSGHSTLADDLKSLLRASKKKFDETTKESMVDARIGQGAFRASVLQMWDHACAVTGCRVTDAIRASHIKPWKDSDNSERLDPMNGLPLIATLDALFDAGLISFEDSGEMIISEKISPNERTLLRLDGLKLRHDPPEEMTEYLAFHRRRFFGYS
ncbi:MAG: HNH endonuclease [Planctomycetaceae bacterium]|nr:HNH endonuclease [Planctomycetaceae bacterium]